MGWGTLGGPQVCCWKLVAGVRCPAEWKGPSGGKGLSLLMGMGKRGLTCPQEAEGSLIPNSSPIPQPTGVEVGMGGAEGQLATLL